MQRGLNQLFDPGEGLSKESSAFSTPTLKLHTIYKPSPIRLGTVTELTTRQEECLTNKKHSFFDKLSLLGKRSRKNLNQDDKLHKHIWGGARFDISDLAMKLQKMSEAQVYK